MPDEEQTPPPEEPTEESPPAAAPVPTPEPVQIETHKEETIVTWTREEKEKLFNSLSEIGEFINGKKTEEPKTESTPAPTPEPKRKGGLRFKSKRK